jgi:hypothetical protein
MSSPLRASRYATYTAANSSSQQAWPRSREAPVSVTRSRMWAPTPTGANALNELSAALFAVERVEQHDFAVVGIHAQHNRDSACTAVIQLRA